MDSPRGAPAAVHVLVTGLETGVPLSFEAHAEEGTTLPVVWSRLVDVPVEENTGLDSRTEQAIQSSLREVERGRTSLVIAHRLSTITDASEIIVMAGGRIAERGTHAALLAKRGLYAEMWARQQAAGDGEERTEAAQ